MSQESGKMEEGRIVVPAQILDEVGFEDGQELSVYVSDGRLIMEPASRRRGKRVTADQLLAHEIAQSFPTMEEILVFMAAVIDVKNRIAPEDTEKARAMGAEIEKILLRSRD